MFSIPGQVPVTITPAAERQISRLMAGKDAYGLKIGLKKGGCAGMEYTMDMVAAAIAVPPIGLGIATLLRRSLFSKTEQDAALSDTEPVTAS